MLGPSRWRRRLSCACGGRCRWRCPASIFFPAGRGEVAASANLNVMNARPEMQPWILSFSYGRALQAPALQAWRGEGANKTIAQQALYQRVSLNSAARDGKYTADMEIE